MRILGLDVGTKNIGLALSDPFGLTAQPLATVRCCGDREKDALAVVKVIDEREVDSLVVGFPKNMDGSEGASCGMAKEFADLVISFRPLPVKFWDERLTSKMAENTMLEFDLSRKKRRKNVDTLAAVLILQNYLDYLQLNGDK